MFNSTFLLLTRCTNNTTFTIQNLKMLTKEATGPLQFVYSILYFILQNSVLFSISFILDLCPGRTEKQNEIVYKNIYKNLQRFRKNILWAQNDPQQKEFGGVTEFIQYQSNIKLKEDEITTAHLAQVELWLKEENIIWNSETNKYERKAVKETSAKEETEVQIRREAQNEPTHDFELIEPTITVQKVQVAICYITIFVALIYGHNNGIDMLCTPLDWVVAFLIIFCPIAWWIQNMLEEADLGEETSAVTKNVSFGVLMFILSEILFFGGFFWAFFHFSLNPPAEIGAVWPPKTTHNGSYLLAPMVNSLLLLSSGLSATYAHTAITNLFVVHNTKKTVIEYLLNANEIHNSYKTEQEVSAYNKELSIKNMTSELEIEKNYKKDELFLNEWSQKIALWALWDTIARGIAFMSVQAYEYSELPFGITDNVYTTIFFIITGLHGLHVGLGLVALWAAARAVKENPYTFMYWQNRLGLLCAIWYWHFVDVVWLFVLLFLYYDVPEYNIYFTTVVNGVPEFKITTIMLNSENNWATKLIR